MTLIATIDLHFITMELQYGPSAMHAFLRKSLQWSNTMSPKKPCSEALVFCLAARTAAAPVPNDAGVEEFASPAPGFSRWLDHWFSTTSEERMRNAHMAYWS
jgi:hypothetical protein